VWSCAPKTALRCVCLGEQYSVPLSPHAHATPSKKPLFAGLAEQRLLPSARHVSPGELGAALTRRPSSRRPPRCLVCAHTPQLTEARKAAAEATGKAAQSTVPAQVREWQGPRGLELFFACGVN
jgi:hypothetical protein